MDCKQPLVLGISAVIGWATLLGAFCAAAPAPVDPQLGQEFQNAVFFKDIEKTKKLLDAHPELAKAEISYMLPLQHACNSGSLEMVQLLVTRGAEPKARSSTGAGPLFNAANTGGLDILKFLVSKGADPKTEDGILGASKTGAIAEYLISLGVDVKGKSNNGDTALHVAARNGNMEVMDALLKHGADIEAKGNFDQRPLQVGAGTIFGDSLATVKYLAGKGADLKSKGFIDGTALHEAAFHGQLKTAEWLIGKGLDVNQKNRNGQTPLDLAKQSNKREVVEMLKKHGVKE